MMQDMVDAIRIPFNFQSYPLSRCDIPYYLISASLFVFSEKTQVIKNWTLSISVISIHSASLSQNILYTLDLNH